ncbi:MAG: quinone-interacting membrane-bound oxidoreductase complex subunit QmoC [Bacteroidales bacterium]|nr:quinone-interacting membrane-bound oxidoreductase complex subunit QmoC [Bacteroidales bacterium]
MIDISPDIEFKKELKRLSKSSLNECMQCGTCSVVCTLAPEERPFPRKEMIWAGWGMKDNLIANTDIWLCHQCGDCSTHCPRNVKPADVFSAIRQISYQHYACPKILRKIVNRPALLPVAILIPVIIIAGILLLAGTFRIPDGPVNYSKFFPHAWLNSSFSLITFLSYSFAISGLVKFWNDLKRSRPEAKPKNGLLISLFKNRSGILSHSKFGKCNTQKSRKISHFLVFYGFIMLLVVTAFAIIAAITHNYPLAFTNPFKILGNVAAVMLVIGLSIMILNRLINKNSINSTYTDWSFLISLFILSVSGVVVEAARFLNWQSAYHLYFFHLVCVWYVIIYLPYSKFGHLVYRTVAIAFANSIGRK